MQNLFQSSLGFTLASQAKNYYFIRKPKKTPKFFSPNFEGKKRLVNIGQP